MSSKKHVFKNILVIKTSHMNRHTYFIHANLVSSAINLKCVITSVNTQKTQKLIPTKTLAENYLVHYDL